MMSKKRLEEIERQLNRAEIKRENLDIYDFQNILEHQLINGNLKWLVKYAKKQAERVQELEEYKNELISLEDNKYYVAELKQQNKRYREALEKKRKNMWK